MRKRLTGALRWLLVAAGIALGILGGVAAGYGYWRNAAGGWEVGVYTAIIGLAVALGTALCVLIVDRLIRSRSAAERARRVVIQSVVILLALGGALAGAGAGWGYAQNHSGKWVAAIFVGLGSAIGAWLIAALLSLLVEMADSLRRLRDRADLPAAQSGRVTDAF